MSRNAPRRIVDSKEEEDYNDRMGLWCRLKNKFLAFHLEAEARTAYEEGRGADALASAQALARVAPDNPWAAFITACGLVEAGRCEEALRRLEQVRAHWPHDPDLHYARGICLDYLEAPREALAAYQQALTLGLDRTEAVKNIGRDFYLLGDFPAAERALRAYCRLAPDDREAHDLLGYVCYRQGKLRDSFGHYESARRLDPMNAKLERNARLLYVKTARS